MEQLTNFFVNPKDSPPDEYYISIVVPESWCVRYVQDSGSEWDSDLPSLDTIEEYKQLKKKYKVIYDENAWITWLDQEIGEKVSTYKGLLEWNTSMVLQYKSYEIIPSGSIVQTDTHIGMIEKNTMITPFMYTNIPYGFIEEGRCYINMDLVSMIKSHIHIVLDLDYCYNYGIYISKSRGFPNPTVIDIDTYGPVVKPPLPSKFTHDERIEYISDFFKLPNSIYRINNQYKDIKFIL